MKRVISTMSWTLAALLIAGLSIGSPGEHSAVFSADAVAADHYEASKAGAEVLAAGGNAADAAAATMLALGVVNPASSGLGGGGFALYYRAADRSLSFLDFRERAPKASDPEMFEVPGQRPEGPANAPSQLGGLASGVPGEAAGIEVLVTRFGELSLREVVAPALRLAEEGFSVSEALARMGSAFDVQLRKDDLMSSWDLRSGTVLKRPGLARALRAFAEHGARVIYGGVIGQEMVSSVREQGGIMTLDDLRAYRVRNRDPIEAIRALHLGLAGRGHGPVDRKQQRLPRKRDPGRAPVAAPAQAHVARCYVLVPSP